MPRLEYINIMENKHYQLFTHYKVLGNELHVHSTCIQNPVASSVSVFILFPCHKVPCFPQPYGGHYLQ